jgi:hypothetical protein
MSLSDIPVVAVLDFKEINDSDTATVAASEESTVVVSIATSAIATSARVTVPVPVPVSSPESSLAFFWSGATGSGSIFAESKKHLVVVENNNGAIVGLTSPKEEASGKIVASNKVNSRKRLRVPTSSTTVVEMGRSIRCWFVVVAVVVSNTPKAGTFLARLRGTVPSNQRTCLVPYCTVKHIYFYWCLRGI